MAYTIYSFYEATSVVDCFVELDDQATAGFAVEVIHRSAQPSKWLSTLDGHRDHASKHRFRVDQPDDGATILLKVACGTAPAVGAECFVRAMQGGTVLLCMDGAGEAVAQGARGVNVGQVFAGKTSVFLLRVIK